MRLAHAPAWDIEFIRWGQWQGTLTGELKFDSIIKDDPGSTNRITLMVRGDEFTPYINGKKMMTVNHNKLLDGLVAFAAWQESGKTSCIFDNGWLWLLDPPKADVSG